MHPSMARPHSRKNRLISRAAWTFRSAALWLFLLTTLSLRAESLGKTMRVEHGRPVLLVSQKSVLLLELIKEPIKDVLVSHDDPNVRHCRARYRYALFDGSSDSITQGEGTVAEIYRTVSRSPTGSQVENLGSQTAIGAGEFSLGWSEASAGSRSWLYYRTDSPIRFIQQPEGIRFETIDAAKFRRYLESRNVQEFLAANRKVQVIGPAVFSGDLPTEVPAQARIKSCRIRDGSFELELSNLAKNKSYVIESSIELKTGNWNAVHTFIAQESDHAWSDPLMAEVAITFYRIREGN